MYCEAVSQYCVFQGDRATTKRRVVSIAALKRIMRSPSTSLFPRVQNFSKIYDIFLLDSDAIGSADIKTMFLLTKLKAHD